jgi:RNA polymerase sigma-70 factor (ECF subfamily)
MEEQEVRDRVRAVLDGEPERFAPLVVAYTPCLYNLASKMTGRREEAAEVVQETFFRAYRDLGRFDGHARFQSWLYGICVNVCYDAGKRRRREARNLPVDEMAVEPRAPSDGGADGLLAARERGARMRECLTKLPVALRAAVLLRFQEERSFAEVAQDLRIGLSAAKMRVQRGLALLRACMDAGTGVAG